MFYKSAIAVRFIDLTLPDNKEKDSIAEVSNKLQGFHQKVAVELTRKGKFELKYFLWQALSTVPAAGPNHYAFLGNRLHELEAVLTGDTLACVADAVFMV